MIDEKKLIEDLRKCYCGQWEMENSELLIRFKGVCEIINNQPKIGAWIPCSERLPEETGSFLVCYKHGNVNVSRYGYNTTHEYKCFWVGYVRDENIIAWQPLPEPYHQ